MHSDLSSKFACRVCGLLHPEPPWGLSGNDPSYEICPCCGVEFGYEDCTKIGVLSYRKRWLDSGGHWKFKKLQPSDWNMDEQMSQIPKDFR